MANRNERDSVRTLDGGVRRRYLQVAIGATGAPTLSAANSQGVRSIARNGAGDYTITLGNSTASTTDTYNRIMAAGFTLTDTTARDFTMQIHTETPSSGTVRVLFNTAAVTTELPNGATLRLWLDVKNSSVV